MTKQISKSKKATISLVVFAVLTLTLGFTQTDGDNAASKEKDGIHQVYHPFIDTSKHWNVMHEGFEVKRTVEYYISAKDTTINDTVYRMVLANEQYGYYPSGIAGFIREDTTERRVYLRPYYAWYHPIEDRLLYDFSIDVGDTLDVYGLYCTYESNKHKVVSRGAIELLNGEQRTVWELHHIDDPYQEPDQWIEGIGSLNGVLFPFCSEDGIISASVVLLCYFEDDVKLYMSAHDTCFVDWTTGVQSNMQYNIQPFPNPVTNVLYLTTHGDMEHFNAYEIYNLSGLKVAEGRFFDHHYTIPVDNLCSGMYFLRIKNELNSQNFKFVKK